MKKLALAIFVAATFIIYSVHQRKDGAAIALKPNVTSGPTPASSVSAGATPATTTPVNTPTAPKAAYKDGRYTGDAADAYYGYIQVAATIQGGKIINVEFLQAPSDRSTSVRINAQADPSLKQEAIQAQSAHVDIVSGATDSSQAFIESLTSA